MKRKIIHKPVVWGAYLAGILLAFSYASSFVSPRVSYLPSLINLFYLPLLLIVLTLLIVTLLLKEKRPAIFLIVVLALGFGRHKVFFAFNPAGNGENCTNKIRLMTYNVKVFNLYDWVKNVHYKKAIIGLIDSVSPDILCLQEYVYDDRKVFDTRDTLIELLGYKYYKESFNARNKYFHFGSAVFSRYPVVSSEPVMFDGSRNFVVKHKIIFPGNDTVCLFNVHFQSIKFSSSEYQYLDSIKTNLEENKIEGLFPIINKLKHAAVVRTMQVDSIVSLIKKCRNKVIVCGDFNDIPGSYTYAGFESLLNDAFAESGMGPGFTFSRFFLPYRIDYVFVSNDIMPCHASVVKKSYSDHYPVVVDLEW